MTPSLGRGHRRCIVVIVTSALLSLSGAGSAARADGFLERIRETIATIDDLLDIRDEARAQRRTAVNAPNPAAPGTPAFDEFELQRLLTVMRLTDTENRAKREAADRFLTLKLLQALQDADAIAAAGGQAFLAGASPSVFLPVGQHAPLTFALVDPVTGAQVPPAGVGSVRYELVPDVDQPDLRVLLGVATDPHSGFALDHVLASDVEWIFATPHDLAGQPLFLRGIDATDNIAASFVVGMSLVPEPSVILWMALGTLVVGRGRSRTRPGRNLAR